MRFLIVVAAAGLIAAPSAAQVGDVPPEVELADRLNDPVVQQAVPAAMAAMLAALMDTRVGGLAALTDPAEDIRPGDTLGDLVARDDPGFQTRAYADARRSTEMMGRMAGSIATIMPELRASADRMRDALGSIAPDDETTDDYAD